MSSEEDRRRQIIEAVKLLQESTDRWIEKHDAKAPKCLQCGGTSWAFLMDASVTIGKYDFLLRQCRFCGNTVLIDKDYFD